MFPLPLRKLLKMLFVRGVSTNREGIPLSLNECLDTVPDSRRRYKRLLLLIITILVCLFVVVYYKSTQDIVRERVFSMITINLQKVNMVNSTTSNINAGEALTPHDLNSQSINKGKIKSNVIPNTTARKATVFQRSNKGRNTPAVKLDLHYKNNEIQLFTVTNNDLPVCRGIGKRNGKEVQYKITRSMNNLFSEVKMGGYYCPKKCHSRHKVAILVPYRNRERNLEIFTRYMHKFLIKQELEYGIFIIEQAGWESFNRGKLFNIAFVEMMRYHDWHCVVLHDVDLLPQSDAIFYTCPTYPRHMVGTIIEKAHLSYDQYHTFFGGVSALSVQHYKQINGFSNLYWGWGGEDNDMYWRILSERLPMVRYNKTIAQYKSLQHAVQPKNHYRYHLLKFAASRYKKDGLSSLEYKVIWTKHRHLYTHILADVNPLRENITVVYRKMFHKLK